MATTPCPNCGKPLRPGSRFCGSCGHVISAGTPAGTPAAQPPDVPQPGGPPCPHCGKPLRAGAKFCNNCGKSIAPSGPVAGSAPPVAAAPPPQPTLSRTPAQKTPGSGPFASTSPARTVPPVARPVAPASRQPRTGLRLGIIISVLVLCVALVGGGTLALDYFGVLPLGIMSKGTETGVAVATTAETTLVPPATTEASPPTKEPLKDVSPTPVTPTQEQSTATQPSPTVTPTLTPEEISLRVILDDNFTTDLPTNWNVWGSPRPRINAKVSPPYLEFTSGDNADAAGVTAFMDVPYKPVVLIEFVASLHTVQGLPMKFYWDKKGYLRKNNVPSNSGGDGGGGGGGVEDEGDGGTCIGPFCPASASMASLAMKRTASGFFPFKGMYLPSLADYLGIQVLQAGEVVGIEVGIYRGSIDLTFPSGKICSAPLNGKNQHTYQVRMLSGAAPNDPPKVELVVDGAALPDCADPFDFDLEGGMISFTGHGMVYSVKVSVP